MQALVDRVESSQAQQPKGRVADRGQYASAVAAVGLLVIVEAFRGSSASSEYAVVGTGQSAPDRADFFTCSGSR